MFTKVSKSERKDNELIDWVDWLSWLCILNQNCSVIVKGTVKEKWKGV